MVKVVLWFRCEARFSNLESYLKYTSFSLIFTDWLLTSTLMQVLQAFLAHCPIWRNFCLQVFLNQSVSYNCQINKSINTNFTSSIGKLFRHIWELTFARLITYFGNFVFGFLSHRLRDFPYDVFRLQDKTDKTKWKINKLLRNILVTSSPKTTKNEVTKMWCNAHF